MSTTIDFTKPYRYELADINGELKVEKIGTNMLEISLKFNQSFVTFTVTGDEYIKTDILEYSRDLLDSGVLNL